MPVIVGTMIEIPRAALIADKLGDDRGVLLLRHERPDADDVRLLARRRRQRSFPSTSRRRSCRRIRSSRSIRKASASSCASAPSAAAATNAETESRRLRRARRRSRLDPLLPRLRSQLRLVLALPRAGRATRGGAGGASVQALRGRRRGRSSYTRNRETSSASNTLPVHDQSAIAALLNCSAISSFFFAMVSVTCVRRPRASVCASWGRGGRGSRHSRRDLSIAWLIPRA